MVSRATSQALKLKGNLICMEKDISFEKAYRKNLSHPLKNNHHYI